MSLRYVPVGVSARDGHGHVLAVEVAGAELRSAVPILAPDGSVAGELTADRIASWDPPLPRRGRVASVSVRRALATNGRLTASVSETGVVLALRVEPRRKSGSTPSSPRAEHRGYPARLGELEYSIHPGGRILSVGDQRVRRRRA